MLKELFDTDRRLRIEHKKLLASSYLNKDIIALVEKYLTDFSNDHQLSVSDLLLRYNSFAARYSDHMKDFILTGKYPYQLGSGQNLSRIDYDIALILSPVVTIHRHRIINKLIQYFSEIRGKILIVGVGSGIELEIIIHFGKEVDVEAYDINITQFVKNRFKQMNIFEKEFSGLQSGYDHILAIEILEHLSDPITFSLMCSESLKTGGNLVATTATNVPHFDHLYNFVDEADFENRLRTSGLLIEEKEVIKNDHFFKDIDAKNTWYVFERSRAVSRNT